MKRFLLRNIEWFIVAGIFLFGLYACTTDDGRTPWREPIGRVVSR